MTGARAARVATAAFFLLCGVGVASWVVRIPAIQRAQGIDVGTLGLVLLGLSAGALVAMPLAGRQVARRGSRPVTRAGALAFAAALPFPALAPDPLSLAAALAVVGAANGVLGVAMNAQAAAVERAYRRPIMASFHALFSLGGLAGSAAGGVLAARGVSVRAHLAGTAAVLAVVAWLAARRLLPPSADATPDAPAFARPTRALAALGVIAFCVLFGEGAMADWTAVYLRDVAGTGPGLAAAGYAAFSLAMAGGRAGGYALTVRLGAVRLVGGGGALAAVGLALAVAVPTPWAAVSGFAAVGAGFAAIFPTVLAAAGRTPGESAGTAIAAVSTFGYTGFLAGPAAIGLIADATSLRAGLGTVAVTSLLVAVLARALRRENDNFRQD
ncbi:MFS transporter [Roseisolibacter sp. H3M3-2]|uniref:MFS transporter n=1 Tax=Roseisolibacter sp. H3M3-2 TaxID=3031323 RepID=UPI0023DB8985|nr:MFS transporter [Roseisolibacter sp. H3M3-2]MDF1504522.1 MFS transporter [Roseisolibacter sp. H3M3-2]